MDQNEVSCIIYMTVLFGKTKNKAPKREILVLWGVTVNAADNSLCV